MTRNRKSSGSSVKLKRPLWKNTIRDEFRAFLKQARPARVRAMRDFAEAELIIPDGPFAGRRFRCHRQPYTRLWFDGIDSGNWNRFVATGPTQSGKTLSCFLIPLLYHLFEVGETVICGLPDMDMAADKWREDILPAIEHSRYRDLLPTQGGGSRGGKVESIRFRNGATLKFMSGGGSDKSRAGFTSRVIVITETDGMDQPGKTSRESDKITQLEARTRAYGSRKRVYMECTVSTEEGRTWQEYQNSSKSRIVLPCPECGAWVTPERDQLAGWKESESQHEARDRATFVCSSCAEAVSEEQRAEMNLQSLLLHEGQTIDPDGTIHGSASRTDTFGFRWSAVNNLFIEAGDVGAEEWKAVRAADEDNAEKEMRQFVWCVPVAPSKSDHTLLAAAELTRRISDWPRGIVPGDAECITAAVDIGKYLAHWIVVAWEPEARGHVIDYARIEVPSNDLGVEKGILLALREFREQVAEGWPVGKADGERMCPHAVWIDAGYMSDTVYEFCKEAGAPFWPAVGRGAAQQRQQWYNRPTSTGSVVKHIGQGFHINLLRSPRIRLIEVNADHWKTWVHTRLATPEDQTGRTDIL